MSAAFAVVVAVAVPAVVSAAVVEAYWNLMEED